MDNPHHQWHFRSLAPRSPPLPPQANSICPVCSNFHFPFCPSHPPPPSYPHQNPRFPPHPGFDPRPWHDHLNPNFDRRNCTQPVHDYYGSTNGFVGECGWNSNKRMRVDENNFQVTSEDERRLKLIRDHGGNGAENAPFLKRNGFNPIKNHVDYNLVHVNDWKNYSFDNQRPPQSIPLFPPSQHVYGNFSVQGGYFPPLPQSPPPPIPVEPPPLSPAPPKASLFPVHVSVPSSYPQITCVSTGFITEVVYISYYYAFPFVL